MLPVGLMQRRRSASIGEHRTTAEFGQRRFGRKWWYGTRHSVGSECIGRVRSCSRYN